MCPGKAVHSFFFLFNGQPPLFLIGGTSENSGLDHPPVEIFDENSLLWSTAGVVPSGYALSSCISTLSRIVCWEKTYSRIAIYNPSTGSWSLSPRPPSAQTSEMQLSGYNFLNEEVILYGDAGPIAVYSVPGNSWRQLAVSAGFARAHVYHSGFMSSEMYFFYGESNAYSRWEIGSSVISSSSSTAIERRDQIRTVQAAPGSFLIYGEDQDVFSSTHHDPALFRVSPFSIVKISAGISRKGTYSTLLYHNYVKDGVQKQYLFSFGNRQSSEEPANVRRTMEVFIESAATWQKIGFSRGEPSAAASLTNGKVLLLYENSTKTELFDPTKLDL